VFPLVFLLTFIAATGQQPLLFMSPGVRNGWLFFHIATIFTGYAALVLSFGASLLYLVQERSLKSKSASAVLSRLPALDVIDQIGYRSLLLGFPFMTLGLLAGIVVAQTAYHTVNFFDQILLSVLMWVVYLVMLYTLECRMARTSRRRHGQPRVCRCGRGLGGELFQHDSWVRDLMRFQLIGLNHRVPRRGPGASCDS
jgi:ABC-type transport system involved in cytochrome c biogenesis permease subunit